MQSLLVTPMAHSLEVITPELIAINHKNCRYSRLRAGMSFFKGCILLILLGACR